MMTMVVRIAVCQYPLTKKIGDQSVVIMTTKQAEDINKKFVLMKDTISIYRNLFQSEQYRHGIFVQSISDSILNLHKNLRYSIGEKDWYKKEYYNMQSDLYKEMRGIRTNMTIITILSAILAGIVTIINR